MKIKLLVLVLGAAFLSAGCASVSASGKPNLIEDYNYTAGPEICFFPKGQAKWDGYKITNKNWGKLDDYLKLMFIFESSKELERAKGVIITIKDSNRALTALNFGIGRINKELPKSEIQVISFFYDVLRDAKMVAQRKTR